MLSLSSLAVALLAVEACLRFGYMADTQLDPGVDLQSDLVTGPFKGLYTYDGRLGWVPGAHARGVRWGVSVTTGADGIRRNGWPWVRPSTGAPILAVGDSFTFGDEVGDAATWPAQLERLLDQNASGGRRAVLNAGVSSYSLGQTLRRTEALVPKYRPAVVIVSFIQRDIDRLLQSVRHGVPKPHYVLGPEGQLEDIPPAPPRTPDEIRRWLLTHSALAQFAAQRGPHQVRYALGAGTMVDHTAGREVSAEAIAVRVMERFFALQAAYRFRLIILAHPTDADEVVVDATQTVLARAARASDVTIVHGIDALRAYAAGSPAQAQSFVHTNWPNHHMSPAGNHFIAELLVPHVLTALDQDS